jgi:hypothetical protein
MMKMGKFVMRNVIGSYMNVLQPKRMSNDDGSEGDLKYSLQIVIPKDHPQLGALKEEIMRVKKEAFPNAKGPMKLGLRDADEEGHNDPRMAGMMFINASAREQYKPQVIDRAGRALTSSDEIYSGCLINVSFDIYAYGKQPGSKSKGVTAGLRNVQLVERRERWDGRSSAADDFGVENDFESGGAQVSGAVEETDDVPW